MADSCGKLRPGPPQPQAQAEQPLRIPIQCPQCSTMGLVGWTSLQNGIRCPECDCEFIVAKGGHIRKLADLPHIRYSCPRCSQSGLIPDVPGGRAAKCPGCGLPLARGPNQRMNGVSEAAEQWKANLGKPRSDSWLDRVRRQIVTPDGRWHRTRIALLAAPWAIAAIYGLHTLTALLDRSPEAMARRFTAACLSDKPDAALAYLEDDAVQQVELDRWRTWQFASILDRHRPDGDAVTIEVKPIESRSVYRILLVTLRSPHIGTRRHVQHWRDHGNRWLFDSRATMAEENASVFQPRGKAATSR
ncbi:MAG TPA: hypothetical protein VF175_11585 [Lacipirellula sp.]